MIYTNYYYWNYIKTFRHSYKIGIFLRVTHFKKKLFFKVRMILAEYKIHNAEVLFREDATMDQFIDVIADNRFTILDFSYLCFHKNLKKQNSSVVHCHV